MQQFMTAEERGKLTSGDVFFEEVGGQFKRTLAFVRLKKDMPQCQKCYTYADYKPPDKTAHMFYFFPGRCELYRSAQHYSTTLLYSIVVATMLT
jgi:hypothetical protein